MPWHKRASLNAEADWSVILTSDTHIGDAHCEIPVRLIIGYPPG